MSETTPYYPEQGAKITADAVYSLLPAGLPADQAKILFIHAHPDDESSSTGATMSLYAQAGAEVDLVTATRGELGEVIPADLKHLEAWQPDTKDGGAGLGRVRQGELANALKVLGVSNHAFLGEGFTALTGTPTSYTDSGMSWGKDGKATVNPDAAATSLTLSAMEPQAQALAAAIRNLRPDVLVTYDAGGGYGHPDHVRVHDMTLAALRLVMGTEFEPKMVWGLEGDFAADDSRLQAVIDGDLAAKRAAMAAHATQITVTSETTFEYSNKVSQPISARETYRLLYSGDGVEADRNQALNSQNSLGGEFNKDEKPTLPSTANSVITSIAVGLLAGTAGTFYHAFIWYQSAEVYFPWGVILSILTLTLACLWGNLRSARSWPGVLTAVTAFALVYAFTMLKGKDGYLVLVNPNYPIGLAGTIWALGTLVSAVLATIIYAGRRRKTYPSSN